MAGDVDELYDYRAVLFFHRASGQTRFRSTSGKAAFMQMQSEHEGRLIADGFQTGPTCAVPEWVAVPISIIGFYGRPQSQQHIYACSPLWAVLEWHSRCMCPRRGRHRS